MVVTNQNMDEAQ